MVTDLIIPGFALPPGFERLLAIMYSVILILITIFTVLLSWTALSIGSRSRLRGEHKYRPSVLLATAAVVINVVALFLVILGLVQIPEAYSLVIFVYICGEIPVLFLSTYWALLSHLDKRATQRHN